MAVAIGLLSLESHIGNTATINIITTIVASIVINSVIAIIVDLVK